MRFRTKYYWALFGYCLCFTVFAAVIHSKLVFFGLAMAFITQKLAAHSTKQDEIEFKKNIDPFE